MKSEASLRELDQSVAKIMGWSWYDLTAVSPNGSHCARVVDGMSGLDPLWWLPHYSTSIEAAWEIIEKLKEHYCFLSIKPNPGGLYICRAFDGSGSVIHDEIEETAPLAICSVALKLLEVGDEPRT